MPETRHEVVVITGASNIHIAVVDMPGVNTPSETDRHVFPAGGRRARDLAGRDHHEDTK